MGLFCGQMKKPYLCTAFSFKNPCFFYFFISLRSIIVESVPTEKSNKKELVADVASLNDFKLASLKQKIVSSASLR